MNLHDLFAAMHTDVARRRLRYASVGGVALLLLAAGGWIDGVNRRHVVSRDRGAPRCVVIYQDADQRVTAEVGSSVSWPGMNTTECP